MQYYLQNNGSFLAEGCGGGRTGGRNEGAKGADEDVEGMAKGQASLGDEAADVAGATHDEGGSRGGRELMTSGGGSHGGENMLKELEGGEGAVGEAKRPPGLII